MLFHQRCQTPVEVTDDLQSEFGVLCFYCKVCEEVVWLEDELMVVDCIGYLEALNEV